MKLARDFPEKDIPVYKNFRLRCLENVDEQLKCSAFISSSHLLTDETTQSGMGRRNWSKIEFGRMKLFILHDP